MEPEIARQLVQLNREFYDAFAAEYSQSRAVLQPGILRAIQSLGRPASLLDLGCGDGRLATGLPADTWYLGVDVSKGLLRHWRGPADPPFVVADLTEPGWSASIPRPDGDFEAVTFFSALHHIPGDAARLQCMREAVSLLAPDGQLVVSVWQFLHQARFRRKRVAWEEVGLTDSDVDPGDVLLDWQRGGRGVRYVHAFGEDELTGLCRDAGLVVGDVWRSDGATHDLGLYLRARRPNGSNV